MGPPFPGPWNFDNHPWLKAMHDSKHPFCVGQKSAQMGYTEVCLNMSLNIMDTKGLSVLYILPNKNPDAGDFSASRFDTALELSPYLQDMFTNVKNVGHKRAGSASLFIRGSQSRSGLKSLPVSFLVFDEVEEMNQENIPLAFERQSGQKEKKIWMISTPTIDRFGINSYFEKSTKCEFFFPCPACGRQTRLIFPECLEITSDDPASPEIKNSFYKCKECGTKLGDKTAALKAGEWVPQKQEAEYEGYHINQMYSPTIMPYELAQMYLLSQVNSAYEQEFYNSKLGLPHIIKGARVTNSEIEECIGNYTMPEVPKNNTVITIGIDVGRWLHYVVMEWTIGIGTPDVNINSTAKALDIGKILDFEDLDTLIRKYRPNATVIDANPERRLAYNFANRFWGYVWLCFYGNGVSGKQITKTRDTDGQELEQQVTVDRTSWLDLTLQRYSKNHISLPINTPQEFKSNITSIFTNEYDVDHVFTIFL